MKRMVTTVTFLFTIYFIASLIFLLEESRGAEFCVSDESGLQNALTNSAANGGNDVVKVVQGNYNGAFAYDSSEGNSISVLGGYTSGCTNRVLNSANTVLDSAGAGTVLDLSDSAGGDMLIEGFTIQNGNNSANSGGGISAYSFVISGASGNIIIADNTIRNNTAFWYGGGIWAQSYSDDGIAGNVTLTDNVITGNTASNSSGGGVRATSSTSTGTSSTVTLANNTISGNTCSQTGSAGGGAMVGSSNENVMLINNTFSDNSGGAGGGVYAFAHINGIATLKQNSFTNNSSSNSSGGGAYAYSDFGKVILTNNTFNDNSASAGGGAYAHSETGTVILTDNSFSDNDAFNSENTYSDGGGAYAHSPSGRVIVKNNSFDTNSSTRDGGGIYSRSTSGGAVTLAGNKMTDNDGGQRGGGAYLYISHADCQINLTNNIFKGNSAIEGGGVFAFISNGGTQIFTNNTFTENSADNGSGGGLYFYIYHNNSSAYIYNNILWMNTVTFFGGDLRIDDDKDSDGTGALIKFYNNDYGDLYIQDGDNLSQGNNLSQNPLLTSDCHLLSGSPCIDKAHGAAPELPRTDFDGHYRPQGEGYDIGADEYCPGGHCRHNSLSGIHLLLF